MNYTAIIIDDEPMARTLLHGMITESCPHMTVIDCCPDLPSGIKSIRKQKPDIVFLDIEMPGHSGLELLDFFNDDEIDFSIIFVTAYNEYAIRAFKLSAIDYLLKPIATDDLKNAVTLFEKKAMAPKRYYSVLKSNMNGSLSKKIALNSLNSFSFVEVDDILFFKGEGSYTKVFLREGKEVTVSKGLKSFENLLADNNSFYRCHKSYIVNIKHISGYVKSEGGYLVVDEKHHVSITGEKVDTVLKMVADFVE